MVREEGARRSEPSLEVGLTAVILAVTEDEPRVLTVPGPPGQASPRAALPSGPLDPCGDRTLERCLRGWVREQTGLELGYVEQLYTFGDRNRHPAERRGGPRVISIAYLALVRESRPPAGGASWQDVYAFLPWEDWRAGRPRLVADNLLPRLKLWLAESTSPPVRQGRLERAAIAFGFDESAWDYERVLERYELMYEAGMVAEYYSDRSLEPPTPGTGEGDVLFGTALAFDHRRILATALGRLRGKIRYRPVVFELLPETFTLSQLQRVVEALAGRRLHTQNFRRLLDRGGLVEGTGELDLNTGGRPAEQFRFRREVLRERRAPGVGLPGQ
ncbi:MAG: NAD regulator [Acidobacteriota bacterium]